MSTTAMVPSLIDDTEFLAQLDALDACDPAVHPADQERSLPFWEERMREGAAAFNELDDPLDDPESAAPLTGLSRAAAFLGLMLCTAAGAGAAVLVFHGRLAHFLR